MPAALPETYGDLFGQEVEWRPAEPVTFWFARHGQSEYNIEDRIGGDSSITAKGQRFADALPALFGSVLQAAGEDPRFISVWTSTLLRTIQTASKLPLPQVHLSELDEIHAGVCDGATYPYIKTYMPYVHYSRKKDKLHYRYPSGESYVDLCRRVWPVLQRIKRHGGARLVVGHQAVLRCIFGYLEGRSLQEITHISVPHHVVFQFTVHPDGSVERRDFPMELVTEAPGGAAAMHWPFDVSHSRPLTASDVARVTPKPKVPLLVHRTASLTDVLAGDAADAAAAAPEAPPADGGEQSHRTVERNVSLCSNHGPHGGDAARGDASTPRLCQSVPDALRFMPARVAQSEPPPQRAASLTGVSAVQVEGRGDDDQEAETFASPVSLAPVSPPRLDADEAAPTFASSIPEKCCSANLGCGGATPGGFQGLRPMDSCGTLSSLIGSKAAPRQAAALSASGEGGACPPGAGPQVTCPACGEVFVSAVRGRGSPRASTQGDAFYSKPPSRTLSSAFEMDDCAPDAAAGATLTVSASTVGDWTCLDNYPGSPCAPYPLVASDTPRENDELAAAFVQLRTGAKRPPPLGAAAAGPDVGVFVADDPRVHAEAQRRRVQDEHGFRFRRDVCVLLETSALAPPAGDADHDEDLLRPAELAW